MSISSICTCLLVCMLLQTAESIRLQELLSDHARDPYRVIPVQILRMRNERSEYQPVQVLNMPSSYGFSRTSRSMLLGSRGKRAMPEDIPDTPPTFPVSRRAPPFYGSRGKRMNVFMGSRGRRSVLLGSRGRRSAMLGSRGRRSAMPALLPWGDDEDFNDGYDNAPTFVFQTSKRAILGSRGKRFDDQLRQHQPPILVFV